MEWTNTHFAQQTIKVEDVTLELQAARDAIGYGVDVPGFVRTALAASRGAVSGSETFAIDLTEVPRVLKERLGLPVKFKAKFELPVPSGTIHLGRSHPAVENLANHVLNAALDPHLEGPARRCGVLRTGKVSRRTTLLLLRHRFHIVTMIGDDEHPLLAEDSQLVAFAGSPQNAEWLSAEVAESLLLAEPDANVAPEQARDFLQKVVEGIDLLRARLAEFARERADALLAAHSRVRQASKSKGMRHRVEAQDIPDVLGVFIYLPKAVSA